MQSLHSHDKAMQGLFKGSDNLEPLNKPQPTTMRYIMKIVTTMPDTGQFVAVWELNCNIWSCALRWVDGELMCFILGYDDDDGGCWITQHPAIYETLNATYIISKG